MLYYRAMLSHTRASKKRERDRERVCGGERKKEREREVRGDVESS
jgi:hypothetical protein